MQATDAQTEQQAPILSFTPLARERIKAFVEASDKPNASLYVGIQGRSSGGFRYILAVVDGSERGPDDIELAGEPFTVLVDPASVDDLRGSTIDFVEAIQGGGIKIENPNPVWRDELARQVQEVLDSRINPGVASHGGFVDLLDVRDGVAYVRLGGGCQGCGMADVTLKQGIEVMIREAVPAITAVRDDTDHASGTNPYFRPAKG